MVEIWLGGAPRASAMAALVAASLAAGVWAHDTASHLLDGSFRGSALRGLLPERILEGREEPEAKASGDLDGRGGPELAVIYREEGSLELAVLTQNESGAWRKMAVLRRPMPAVNRMQFVTLTHGSPQLLFVHWMLGGSARIGQLEILAWSKKDRTVEPILTVPATTYYLEDLDGDRVPELIAEKDAPGVDGVPDVYHWDGLAFAPMTHGVTEFYSRIANRFLERAEGALRAVRPSQPAPLAALDNLLNGAESLERAGKKDAAFRIYRRVAALAQSGLLGSRSTDSLEHFRELRAGEAREAMARLLGKQARPKPTVEAAASTPAATRPPAGH